MHCINLAQPVTNLDGTVCVDDKGADIMMSTMCVNILLMTEQEPNATGKDKLMRFLLAQRIHAANGTGVSLSAEDIVLLKDLFGRFAMPLIVGRLYAVLDPQDPIPEGQ